MYRTTAINAPSEHDYAIYWHQKVSLKCVPGTTNVLIGSNQSNKLNLFRFVKRMAQDIKKP